MNIAIIGGAGKMGVWLARALAGEGQRVILIDCDQQRLTEIHSQLQVETSTELKRAREADAVVLSVPINGFEGVVKELAPFTRQGQVCLDITSIKTMPVEAMHRYLPGCVVLGTHPVFGPGAEEVRGHNVVLTPTNAAEDKLAEELRSYLTGRGARVTLMTPGRHDELMAVVLGLSHFIALAAGDTLLHLENLADIEPVSGVTFRALLTFVSSVLGENPDMYAAIQMNLPALPALEQDFIQRAGAWAELVKKRESSAFARRMSDLKNTLASQNLDTGRAYADIYRLTRPPKS